MSLPSHEAPEPPPRSPRRWLRFSLGTLLIVMTLVCIGIVAKQQYDWHWRQKLIHGWIARARPAQVEPLCRIERDAGRRTMVRVQATFSS